MNIVLFGSTGMLGRYVYYNLKESYNVICIKRHQFDIENDEWSKLQHLLCDNLNYKIKENDIIINCAGIIPQKYKNDHFKTYIRVNTLFPHKLNEISKQIRCRFIHITTDCVFDGSKGNYSINDLHTSKDIYGISKSQGEPEEATIIRTSIIGEELCGKKSLIEWVKTQKNDTINGYTNHYWNGVTCLELAKYINNIIDNNAFWSGVRHICSPNIVTKYKLCCYINEIYELNINIEKYEDSISKNMTLCGDYISENTIFDQIKIQKTESTL
jgi:dTDP-4-dehydrorhamnose reductase